MRLRHPKNGTVIQVGAELGQRMIGQGWVDADADVKPKRGRPRKETSKEE